MKSKTKKPAKAVKSSGLSVTVGSPPVPGAFGIFLNGNLQMDELAQPGHMAPAIFMTFAAAQHHCRDDEDIVPINISRAHGEDYFTRLVDAFLSWPLPDSVCSDLCVTEHGHPHRIGANLLTAVEARQMFEHALANSRDEGRAGIA